MNTLLVILVAVSTLLLVIPNKAIYWLSIPAWLIVSLVCIVRWQMYKFLFQIYWKRDAAILGLIATILFNAQGPILSFRISFRV